MSSETEAAIFHVTPIDRFKGQGSTTIRRPRHFLEFSYDQDRQLHLFSDQSLSYYYPPYPNVPGVQPPPIYLYNGFETWQRRDESVDGHLDALLLVLQAHEERAMKDGVGAAEARVQADVVTWRGMMTKIMTTVYDRFSDFEMNATCYQGTIFIEENHAYAQADKVQQNNKPTQGIASQEMMQYAGYKFEHLSVLPRPWAEVDRDEIANRDNQTVNDSAQYISVVRTGIGSSSLILAGEVDCIMGSKPSNPDHAIPWVELKTSAAFDARDGREAQKFERKLLKFWAQSFLLGVPRIVVGFRSKTGYLSSTTEFETQRIPALVSRRSGEWDGNVCITATAAILEFLKEVIRGNKGEGEGGGVWRIKRAKNDARIRVWKVLEKGYGGIVTEDFRRHRERMLAAEVADKLGHGVDRQESREVHEQN